MTHALVIGINDYPASTGLSSLHGAVADAVDFARWAIHKDGGGVPIENLYFWTYPAPSVDAAVPELAPALSRNRPWPVAVPDFSRVLMGADITRAIEGAANLAAEKEPAERLLIFLAGHGVQIPASNYTEEPQNCFVAGDYVAGDSYGLVPLDDTRRLVQRRGPAVSLLFFDCCRNSAPLNEVRPILQVRTHADRCLNQQYLTGHAARSGCVAFETPSANPERGAFSKILIHVLRQYRVDGQLNLTQLREFVIRGVKQLVDPRIQIPEFSVKPDDTPTVILRSAPIGDPPALTIHFDQVTEGEIDILDIWGRTVRDCIPVEGAAFELANLAVGMYILQHRSPGRAAKAIHHIGPEPTHVSF
jgi:Caspase domain